MLGQTDGDRGKATKLPRAPKSGRLDLLELALDDTMTDPALYLLACSKSTSLLATAFALFMATLLAAQISINVFCKCALSNPASHNPIADHGLAHANRCRLFLQRHALVRSVARHSIHITHTFRTWSFVNLVCFSFLTFFVRATQVVPVPVRLNACALLPPGEPSALLGDTQAAPRTLYSALFRSFRPCHMPDFSCVSAFRHLTQVGSSLPPLVYDLCVSVVCACACAYV